MLSLEQNPLFEFKIMFQCKLMNRQLKNRSNRLSYKLFNYKQVISILAYMYTVQYTFSDGNVCSITFLSLGVYTVDIYDIVIVFIYFSFTIALVEMG